MSKNLDTPQSQATGIPTGDVTGMKTAEKTERFKVTSLVKSGLLFGSHFMVLPV